MSITTPSIPREDATALATRVVDSLDIYGREAMPRYGKEQALIYTIAVLLNAERTAVAAPLTLAALDTEQIIDHVAAWPTSNETLVASDTPDLIDEWIRLARRLRARDYRSDFGVIEGGKA